MDKNRVIFPVAMCCLVGFMLGGFMATTSFIRSWDEIPDWCYERIQASPAQAEEQ